MNIESRIKRGTAKAILIAEGFSDDFSDSEELYQHVKELHYHWYSNTRSWQYRAPREISWGVYQRRDDTDYSNTLPAKTYVNKASALKFRNNMNEHGHQFVLRRLK